MQTSKLFGTALLAVMLSACGGSGGSGANTSSISSPSSSTPAAASSQAASLSSAEGQASSAVAESSVGTESSESVQPSSAQQSSEGAASSEGTTSSEGGSSSVPVVFVAFEEDFDGATTENFFTDYRLEAGESVYIRVGGTITLPDETLTLTSGRFTIGAKAGALDLSKTWRLTFDIIATSGGGNFQIYPNKTSTSGKDTIFSAAVSSLGTRFDQTFSAVGANSFLQFRAEGSSSITLDNIRIEHVEGGGSSAGTGASSAPSGGGNSSTGSTSSTSGGGPGGGPVSSSSNSSMAPPDYPDDMGGLDQACFDLVTEPSVNWRETALQTDHEIVSCLAESLGRPVGYGENAQGGYDPAGNSRLVIIRASHNHPEGKSVEEQLQDAIAPDDHKWIVFDKVDFAAEHEISFHRLWCDDSAVLTRISGGVTPESCRNYTSWCSNNGISDHKACMQEFFNKRLNLKSLPIRNPIVGSNTTVDGRMSQAYFRFMGFRIGNDNAGSSTKKSDSVILTHLDFRGAGHTEDHNLDPDMVRNTGQSQHIWIHKNNFDLTGDSAFDVKVGAGNITISFNRIVDVERAALHGHSDGNDRRSMDQHITSTMHHNAFITRDDFYRTARNTARRAPLLRFGTSHMFNNLFFNYRKYVSSVRGGGTLYWQNNAFVTHTINMEKKTVEQSMNEMFGAFVDIKSGNFRADDVYHWYSDASCLVDASTQYQYDNVSGSVGDISANYNTESQQLIADNLMGVDQNLIDYISATAGKYGQVPFNSPLSGNQAYVLSLGRISCQ